MGSQQVEVRLRPTLSPWPRLPRHVPKDGRDQRIGLRYGLRRSPSGLEPRVLPSHPVCDGESGPRGA